MKNFLAIFILIMSVCYSLFCYAENTKTKKEVLYISTEVENETKTAAVIDDALKKQQEIEKLMIEKAEFDFFEVSKDENYELNKKAINALKNTLGENFDIRTNDNKKIALMKDMFNIVVLDKKNKRRNFNDDKNYQNELIQRINEKGLKFLGDSQISVFGAYAKDINKVLNCFLSFKGKNIDEECAHIEEFLTPDIKMIVFFNGCNIAPYDTGEKYVNSYKKMIEKVHSYNPEIKIFITSLLPATPEAIKENINEGDKNKYYNTPMLDMALRKEFRFNNKEAMYIETKWIPDGYIYNKDGLHFRPELYYSYLPYVLDFIEFFS